MSDRGERIGPYRLLSELGRGGMGVVHLALDPSGREVAVKSIASDDHDVAARLLREASVRIAHPNVVRILGAGLDPSGRPYVVMERLVGRSLAAHFATGLRPADVIAYVAQAADGVAALHDRGIVHRDLKPANLFVTDDGVVKVLDFGAAVLREAATLLTLSGALVGTPSYLSPEQARGEHVIDVRADVWALGVVLFEGLTGRRPFARTSTLATVVAVLEAPTPALGLPESEGALAQLVARCLSKDRDGRPAHARALAEQLRAVPRTPHTEGSPTITPTAIVPFRRIALVLVDDAHDRAALTRRAEAARGMVTPILARAAAISFGQDTARGDELSAAVRFALEIESSVGRAVVTTARVRTASVGLDPTALADAQRLLAIAVRGVLVSSEIADLLGPSLRAVRIDRDAVLALSFAHEVGVGSFVGREEEYGRLTRVLDRVIAGDGPQVCSILGVPGIGKSTLAREFVQRSLRECPDLVVVETITRHADASPFASLSEALGVMPMRAAEAEPRQGSVDPHRSRVIDALSALLEGGLAVAVVLDDMPWLEAATRALATELVSVFEGRRLMLIVTSREPVVGLYADETIALGPLRAVDVGEIAARMLARPIGAAVAVELSARAGGNPLFVEQLLGRARALRSSDDIATWSLSPTIENAVQAQLDSLEPELRDAILRLSVLGPEMDPSHAQFALGRPAEAVVAALVDVGVLERVRHGDREMVRFKSRLVSEVAYGLFDAADVGRIHREIATHLAARPGTSAELIARHALRGGDAVLASSHARRALVEAARVGDGATVIRNLDLALREASDTDRFEMTFHAAESAQFVDGAQRHRELLQRALVLAPTPNARAIVEAELAERLRRDGSIAEAHQRLARLLTESLDLNAHTRAACRYALVLVSEGQPARALEIVGEPDAGLSAATGALVWDTRGYVHGVRGELGARRRAYERAGALSAEAGNPRRSAGVLANLGESMLRMGAIDDAERTLRAAVDGARRVGSALTEAYARTNLGAALTALDRHREAVAVLDTAIRMAGRLDDFRLESIARLYRVRITEDAAPGALRSLAEASHDDAPLHALALAALLEARLGDDTTVAAAIAVARRGAVVEEAVLDLCRALALVLPLDDAAALVTPHLDRTYASLDEPSWARGYVAHVRRHYARIGEQWLATHSDVPAR